MANEDRWKKDTMSAAQINTFQYVGQETGKKGGGSKSEVGEKKKRSSMSIEDESNNSAAAGNKNGI